MGAAMQSTSVRRVAVVFALLTLVALLTDCDGPGGTEPTSVSQDVTAPVSDTSSGISDEAALPLPERLALGTLILEDTEDAVTGDQARQLLPLWQILQGTALQGESERQAVAKQIASAMTEGQVNAIEAMQLTHEDEAAWVEARGPMGSSLTGDRKPGGGQGMGGGLNRPGGGAGGSGGTMSEEDRAAMRERFESMTEDERAEMRAQFARRARGTGLGPGDALGGTIRAVVVLLMERSGQAAPMARRGRATPITAVEEVEPASDPEADIDHGPAATPELTATPAPSPTSPPADEPVETAATDEATAAAGDDVAAIATTDDADDPLASEVKANFGGSAPVPALAQVPDENPGPPFSVEISLNRAEPSPLLDGLSIYTVSGLLRNDGDQVYAVNTVNFTFYDADGFRGAFYRFPQRRYGEWIEHGAMEATFDCMLLAPGEACPFIAEIAAYNMGSFYVHADAAVAEWRKPALVEIRNPSLVDQGSNVRISGTIHNSNDYAIKNVVVDVMLLDGHNQITSMGAAYYVLSIAPGASVPFHAMVPADTYATYGINAQAEGDFRSSVAAETDSPDRTRSGLSASTHSQHPLSVLSGSLCMVGVSTGI